MNDVLHTHAVRVYWEDTDAGGVVFYANYLKFFERARTEWMRGLGWGQEGLRSGLGLVFVVAETQVRYKAPARLDDALEITVRLKECRGASLTIGQEALRDGQVLALGEIRVVCVDATTLRPRPIPNELMDAIQA